MLLRLIAGLAFAAILASYAFNQYRTGAIRSWLTLAPEPKPFVFDNGSVRDVPEAPASVPTKIAALSPPGVLRKCVRGDQVTYSNLTCPPGFKERPVATDRVTVFPTEGAKKPEATTRAQGAQKTLHNALDLRTDDQLRQKMIDRAVAAETK